MSTAIAQNTNAVLHLAMMTNEQLSARIRAEVGVKRITRKALAEQVGISRQTFYNILNGETPIANENALAMLDKLGLELTIQEKPAPPSQG